jgi:hypothetical protein
MTDCPDDDDLVRWGDDALTVERAAKVETHVARCRRCRERNEALRALVADLKAAVARPVDVQAHTRAVMDRIDAVDAAARTVAWPRRAWWIASAGSVASCALGVGLYFALHATLHATRDGGEFEARGGGLASTTARDVGVQPYAAQGALRPLTSGTSVDAATPLTAGFRNLGQGPAYLLLFAIDSRRMVHWISPAYARASDDPVSTMLAHTVDERLLGTTAVLEDVAPGPLRIVAVITATPAHVSDVEAFEGRELGATELVRRLPGADVRETVVDMSESGGAR